MHVRPDPELSRIVADATAAAIGDLRHSHPDTFYAIALLASGELDAAYVSACSVEADEELELEPCDLAGTPYALWGFEEHFDAVTQALAARGDLFELEGDDFSDEGAVRLASIEEALRILDVARLFGTGAARHEVLLIAGTMPPDKTDAGFVRRLNPPSPRYEQWLSECSEQPTLTPAGPPAAIQTAAPNPSIAELWRCTSELQLPDGITVYGPDAIAERNETYEIAEYAPGWALVGDDSGGPPSSVRLEETHSTI